MTPPEDPVKLAEAITNLINNPDLREALSAKALKQSQNFTEEKNAGGNRKNLPPLIINIKLTTACQKLLQITRVRVIRKT